VPQQQIKRRTTLVPKQATSNGENFISFFQFLLSLSFV